MNDGNSMIQVTVIKFLFECQIISKVLGLDICYY